MCLKIIFLHTNLSHTQKMKMMKKIFFAIIILTSSAICLVSCKAKEKCDAYKSSAPAHTTDRNN